MALVDDAEQQLTSIKSQLQANEITEEEYNTKRNQILSELEDELSCWICFEIYQEPVTLSCGHNYCRSCCVAMYQKNPLCAFCRRGYGLPIPEVNQELQQQALRFIALRDDEPTARPVEIEQSAFDMDVPEEIWLLIFGLLESNQLTQVRQVCRQWKRLSEDGYLWRNLCTARWPFVSAVKHRNWQQCYIFRHKAGERFTQGRPQDFKLFTLRFLLLLLQQHQQ